MSKARFPNGEFLINRAEQCRSMARILVDPMVRDRMIDLALGYEEIARSAAKLKIENIKVESSKTKAGGSRVHWRCDASWRRRASHAVRSD